MKSYASKVSESMSVCNVRFRTHTRLSASGVQVITPFAIVTILGEKKRLSLRIRRALVVAAALPAGTLTAANCGGGSSLETGLSRED